MNITLPKDIDPMYMHIYTYILRVSLIYICMCAQCLIEMWINFNMFSIM